MQPARSVFLDDEARRAFNFFRQRFARRLSCFLEVALTLVFGQSHSAKLPADCRTARKVVASPRTATRCRQYCAGERLPSAFAGQRLAHEVANEAPDYNVLSQFGDLT